MSDDVQQMTGEHCPFCHQKTMTLTEARHEVPYFGVCYLLSMDCSNCKYHKSDVEAEEEKPPVKWSFTVTSEEDMSVRVVKSANATVKFGSLGSMEPGDAANGFITNIEGLLNRLKQQIEHIRDAAKDNNDDAIQKKCKNALKKLTRIMWGQEPLKLEINDPTGNSAIISEKAEKK